MKKTKKHNCSNFDSNNKQPAAPPDLHRSAPHLDPRRLNFAPRLELRAAQRGLGLREALRGLAQLLPVHGATGATAQGARHRRHLATAAGQKPRGNRGVRVSGSVSAQEARSS